MRTYMVCDNGFVSVIHNGKRIRHTRITPLDIRIAQAVIQTLTEKDKRDETRKQQVH